MAMNDTLHRSQTYTNSGELILPVQTLKGFEKFVGMEEVIVGVVGTLQFDVFQYRMYSLL